LALKINSQYYISLSYGIRGWAFWKKGDKDLAKANLKLAQEHIAKFPAINPVKFVYMGPLMGLALEEGDFEKAVECAKEMLQPNQQKIPEIAESSLADAVRIWENGEHTESHHKFHHSIKLLQESGTGYV